MPERVTDREEIERATLVDDVDRARVDDAQEGDRLTVLGDDDRAARMKLDRRLRGDLGQLVGRERVKRRPQSEKADDLGQAGIAAGGDALGDRYTLRPRPSAV